MYKQVDLESRIEGASPHRLVQMLFEGALGAIAEAQGEMSRGNLAQKGACITRAVNIVSGLRDSLKTQDDSALPYDLDRLYDYMQRRLLEAHAHNNAEALTEVSELLHTLKSGWDGIAE